jgi:hypothetical protein
MRKFQKLLVGAMMLSVSIFSSQVHAEEAQAVPGKEGLVAHYTFDTGKGDVLPDASGNGWHSGSHSCYGLQGTAH